MLIKILFGFILPLCIIHTDSSTLVSFGKTATVSKSGLQQSCAATDGDLMTPCRAIYDPKLLPYSGSFIRLDLVDIFKVVQIIVWPMKDEKNLATGFVVYLSVTEDNPLQVAKCNFGAAVVSTNLDCQIEPTPARFITLYKYFGQDDLLISEIQVFSANASYMATTSVNPSSASTLITSSQSSVPITTKTSNSESNRSLSEGIHSGQNSLNSTSIGLMIALGVALLVVLFLSIAVFCLVIKLRKATRLYEQNQSMSELPRPSKISREAAARTMNTYMNGSETPGGTIIYESELNFGTSDIGTVKSGSYLEPSYDYKMKQPILHRY